jgi:hypothetical protein
LQGVLVLLLGGHGEQFRGIAQTAIHAAQGLHHLFQPGPLAAQFLGTFGIIPDVRVFQLATDFDQAFPLGIEVKDTP